MPSDGTQAGRDALVGVRLTAWPLSRVRALGSARAGDPDPPERARLTLPTAAIAVLEFTGTWQEPGPERAQLTTSVGAVMRDIRRSERPGPPRWLSAQARPLGRSARRSRLDLRVAYMADQIRRDGTLSRMSVQSGLAGGPAWSSAARTASSRLSSGPLSSSTGMSPQAVSGSP